jgi:hypothetical protein
MAIPMKQPLAVAFAVLALLSFAPAQTKKPAPNDMPGMEMPASTANSMNEDEGGVHAMRSMQGRHMDMGPHMKMTARRDSRAGDAERAAKVVEAARKVAGEYRDYKVALADGFKIFMPNVPQRQYHFTNYEYGFEAVFHFDPAHPTSLLYEKDGEGYKLVGVMYTAAKNASEDELNQRIPLSVAQWHAHVNLCLPPRDRRNELLAPHPQFGLAGSITTQTACDAAGGKFLPQVFGWMVHVYPFAQKPEDVWSVERQGKGHME